MPEPLCFLCASPIVFYPGRGVDCGQKGYAHLRCFLEHDRKKGAEGKRKVESLAPAYEPVLFGPVFKVRSKQKEEETDE